MLYNNEYLYIHIPRTAGKCVKSAIIPFMEKPIFLCQKHISSQFYNSKDFVRLNPSLVHCSMEELNFLIENNNRTYEEVKDKIIDKKKKFLRLISKNQHLPNIKQIENIIVCLRNPLDRARSLYKYNFFLGKRKYIGDFESFTGFLAKNKQRFYLSSENFFLLNKKILNNTRFIKFESLEKDLCKLFNVEKINVEEKRHNQVKLFSSAQKNKFFKINNIQKVISNLNTWEKWSIDNGLLDHITEKDFYI